MSGPSRDTTRTLPSRRRRVIAWILLPLGLYAAWCAALYLAQDRMMFPTHLLGPGLRAPPSGFVSIVIEPEEGGRPVKVEAVYAPAPGASPARPAPLLVFFHGNAEQVDDQYDLAGAWRSRGFGVLLFEYRGYGRSTGTPSQRHFVADARAIYDLVAARPEVDPTRIILHGRSVGGAVAAQLAAVRPAAGVITESAFVSVPAVASRFLAPPFLIRNPFRTDRALAEFGGPVLLLHGLQDEIIGVSHGRRLHRALPNSTLVELAGGHNDFPRDPGAYWSAIDAFLAKVVPAPVP